MKHLVQKSITVFTILLGFVFLLTVSAHAQQAQYPISQLGNCRDAQECSYYCQIPHNFPSCWSYGKYVLNKNVLGDSTKSPEEIAREHGVTFPIAELGNCHSPEECMQYCNIQANQQACTDFGKKKGLLQNNTSQSPSQETKILLDAKVMLGCDSRQTCMAFCNDPSNQQLCEQFAKKEGFTHQNNPQSNTPQITLETMKQELGCDSAASCQNVCNLPENYAKCDAFGRKHHLISDQQQQNTQPQTNSSNMQTPPCTDQASCIQWCKDNPDKCQQQNNQYPQPPQEAFTICNGKSSGMSCSFTAPRGIVTGSCQIPSGQTSEVCVPSTPEQNQQQANPMQHGTSQMGCRTDQECNQYCQSHLNQCPGFPQTNFMPSPFQPTNQP